MSDIFSVSPAARDPGSEFSPKVTVDNFEPEPDAFGNLSGALGNALPRMFADVANTVAFAGVGASKMNPWLAFLDEETVNKSQDEFFNFVDDSVGRARDYWTPDTKTTGSASRAVAGLAGALGALALGGGNPSLMLANSTFNTSLDLTNQGVDPLTAVGVGTVQSAALAAGFRLPAALGVSMPAKIASGAAMNLGMGVTSDAASVAILKTMDYNKQAEGFDPTDVERRLLDVLLGGAFGAIARGRGDVAEAAFTEANARHFNNAAPGPINSFDDLAAHSEAMDTATRQLMDGEPVNLDGGLVQRLPMREVDKPPDLLDVRNEPDALPRSPTPEAMEDAGSVLDQSAPADIPMPKAGDAKGETGDPVVNMARAAVDVEDMTVPIVSKDADGNDVVTNMSARDYLAKLDEEEATATKDANAFTAAINCFLGGA